MRLLQIYDCHARETQNHFELTSDFVYLVKFHKIHRGQERVPTLSSSIHNCSSCSLQYYGALSMKHEPCCKWKCSFISTN